MRRSYLFICLLLFTGIAVFANDRTLPQRTLVLNFQHTIGKEELVLGNTFINSVGDTISVQKFKYYLSNFSVTDEKGKEIRLPAAYFLVDETDPSSKTITLTIPDINIKSIRFMLGVDSIKNVSGIQTGALDPLKGMFWTWNSGYIMAKLEGTSASSRIAGQSFAYHIGGFRTPMHTMRTVDLAIENPQSKEIRVKADINHWFKNRSELRIGETPVCHSPGPLAVRIADNYSAMFSINNIQ